MTTHFAPNKSPKKGHFFYTKNVKGYLTIWFETSKKQNLDLSKIEEKWYFQDNNPII